MSKLCISLHESTNRIYDYIFESLIYIRIQSEAMIEIYLSEIESERETKCIYTLLARFY